MRTRNFVKGIVVSLLTVMMLPSCSDENGSDKAKTRFEPIPFTTEETAALNATRPFSVDLFRKYCELSGDLNVAISPLSATFAMAMLANGATDDTQAEILNALGFKGESGLENMNSYARRLMQNLGKTDPSTEAVIANAMFYKNGIEVGKAFADRLNKDYDADALSFAPDKYAGAIDDWITKKTNGAIKKLNLGYDKSNFSLLNAISFKGRWEDPFEKGKTRKYPFMSQVGGITNVDYLCDKRVIWLSRNEDIACARLDFGNGAYSIEFIKPLEFGIDFNGVMEKLNANMLDALHSNGKRLEVNLRIPKIDITLKSDLVPALESMGIEKVFNFGAQLGDMLPKADASVYIDQVNQGCTFSIDEDGVVAQVVTIVSDIDIALPIYPGGDFFLDHPFVFAIRENSSGAILFMGKIGKL